MRDHALQNQITLNEARVLSPTFISILEWALILVAVGLAVAGTWQGTNSDLATSRFATVYSLTEYGTWYLERPLDEPPNPFEQNTIDKVVVNGHILSSKPPLFSLLMTAEYVVLRAIAGWDLENEENLKPILLCMTLTFVTAAYALTLWFFLKTLYILNVVPFVRIVMLASLAFGTQLLGFAMVLNNHVPAACALTIATYFALGMGMGRLSPTPWRFLVFGVCGGMEIVFDLPGAIFVALLGLYLLVKFPRQTLTWTLLGGVLPVATQSVLYFFITGNPLPVQMRWDCFLSESSYWRHPLGIDGLNEPKSTYLFHMTLGRKGIFVLFPVLLAGAAGFLRALKAPKDPLRTLTLGGALGFFILTAYYAHGTNNYGGEAYGFRWFIIAMPTLMLMGTRIFESLLSGQARPWRRAACGVFLVAMLAVSCYSSYECARVGFKSNQEWTCRILGPSFELPE